MKAGFRAAAEQLARQIRRELDLELSDRLDPLDLADYLGVAVYPLHRLLTFGAGTDDVRAIKAGGGAFSAMTVRDSAGSSLIVYNERHAPTRMVNSVCHEIAHLLEGHEPRQLVSSDGRVNWDKEEEEQADWLAAAMLVPRAGALETLDRGLSVSDAADHFGVSEQLFRWRVNVTGVARQLRYRAAKRESQGRRTTRIVVQQTI